MQTLRGNLLVVIEPVLVAQNPQEGRTKESECWALPTSSPGTESGRI